jgi:hypothetical protein
MSSSGSYFGSWAARRNPKKPVFDFRTRSCHSAPMEMHALAFRLPANAPEAYFGPLLAVIARS